MSNLFQLVQTDLPTFIDPLYDVPGNLVGDRTLFSGRIETASMNVGLGVPACPLDSLASHVGSGMSPHGIESRAIRVGSMLFQVLPVTELSPSNQSGPSRSLGTIFEARWARTALTLDQEVSQLRFDTIAI